MKKRVFIVHGWGSSPKEDWFPWIVGELKKKDFVVRVLKMPHTNHPKIKSWVGSLKKAVGKPDENTYLIGHSIGCQTIMRYLETIKLKVGGILLVAGWFTLRKPLETKEEDKIVKPWLETPINIAKVKSRSRSFVAILSDNDPVVPLTHNAKSYRTLLGAKVIILKKKYHIDGNNNILKLPIAVKEIVRMSS